MHAGRHDDESGQDEIIWRMIRTMGPGEHARATPDGAYVSNAPSIGAISLTQDKVSHYARLDALQSHRHGGRVIFTGVRLLGLAVGENEGLLHLLLDDRHSLAAHLLQRDGPVRILDFCANLLPDDLIQPLGGRLEVLGALLFAEICRPHLDCRALLCNGLLPQPNRLR